MTEIRKRKDYLNDVMSLKYAKEDDLKLKKGSLAILTEEYDLGRIDIVKYEIRKRIVEKEIEVLSRNNR